MAILSSGDRFSPGLAADGNRCGPYKILPAKAAGDRFIPVLGADGNIIASKIIPVKTSGQRGIPALAADGTVCLVTSGGQGAPGGYFWMILESDNELEWPYMVAIMVASSGEGPCMSNDQGATWFDGYMFPQSRMKVDDEALQESGPEGMMGLQLPVWWAWPWYVDNPTFSDLTLGFYTLIPDNTYAPYPIRFKAYRFAGTWPNLDLYHPYAGEFLFSTTIDDPQHATWYDFKVIENGEPKGAQ